jgi:hypothetical protein
VYLDAAIRDAIVIGVRVEEASALCELAAHALHSHNLVRAENQLRRAYELLSPEDAATAALRATVHRHLAEARHQQGLNDEETEFHAAAALKLDDQDARLALRDYALLERIRASRGRRSTSLAATATVAESDDR